MVTLMKFLLRYLTSYVIIVLLIIATATVLDQDLSYFRYLLFYIITPANFVISVLFFAVMPYIPKKVRVSLLVILSVGFVYCCLINFLWSVPAILLVQLAIPNFHDGDHYLDKKLNWWQSALLAVVLLAAIIKYLFF